MTVAAGRDSLGTAKSSVRDQALDAVSVFLRGHAWSAVTMAAVAREAGVSRQTLYNEFGSRKGLAVAYVTRFVDGLLEFVRDRVEAHPGEIASAIEDALRGVFVAGMEDPVVLNIAGPNPHNDLMGIVTVDGTPILRRAAEGLAEILVLSWAQLRRADASAVSMMLVRLVFSYLTMPLDEPTRAARDIAAVIEPYLERSLRS